MWKNWTVRSRGTQWSREGLPGSRWQSVCDNHGEQKASYRRTIKLSGASCRSWRRQLQSSVVRLPVIFQWSCLCHTQPVSHAHLINIHSSPGHTGAWRPAQSVQRTVTIFRLNLCLRDCSSTCEAFQRSPAGLPVADLTWFLRDCKSSGNWLFWCWVLCWSWIHTPPPTLGEDPVGRRYSLT